MSAQIPPPPQMPPPPTAPPVAAQPAEKRTWSLFWPVVFAILLPITAVLSAGVYLVREQVQRALAVILAAALGVALWGVVIYPAVTDERCVVTNTGNELCGAAADTFCSTFRCVDR